jgi:hypothetical protein
LGGIGRVAIRAVQSAVGTAVLLTGVAALIAARMGLATVGGVIQDPSKLSADDLKAAAASQLEAAVGPLGTGYAFEIVQTSTITARPGGPQVEIPDPANGRQVIGTADSYPYYTLLEQGIVKPTGFWSEIRSWPVNGGTPNFEKGELRRSALVVDGAAWRNDRDGWYKADVLPGIGLDPESAGLLPRLLRQSDGAVKRADLDLGGSSLLRVDATGHKDDFPGVVAADGVEYTKLVAPIEFGFDELGRLLRIHAVALNTNLDKYDLVVDTVITIRYDWVGNLPQPEPRLEAATAEGAE